MNLEEQLEIAKKEALHWKHVAAYLAECHAATLEGLPKSSAQSARKRLATICTDSVRYLKGQASPPVYGSLSKEERIGHAIERCAKSAVQYGVPPAATTTGKS